MNGMARPAPLGGADGDSGGGAGGAVVVMALLAVAVAVAVAVMALLAVAVACARWSYRHGDQHAAGEQHSGVGRRPVLFDVVEEVQVPCMRGGSFGGAGG